MVTATMTQFKDHSLLHYLKIFLVIIITMAIIVRLFLQFNQNRVVIVIIIILTINFNFIIFDLNYYHRLIFDYKLYNLKV